MTITFSEDVLQTTHMSPEELVVEMAVHLFEIEKLTLGQASKMAGMSQWDFQQVLGSRNIPLHYGVEEFEKDMKTLKEHGWL